MLAAKQRVASRLNTASKKHKAALEKLSDLENSLKDAIERETGPVGSLPNLSHLISLF